MIQHDFLHRDSLSTRELQASFYPGKISYSRRKILIRNVHVKIFNLCESGRLTS